MSNKPKVNLLGEYGFYVKLSMERRLKQLVAGQLVLDQKSVRLVRSSTGRTYWWSDNWGTEEKKNGK